MEDAFDFGRDADDLAGGVGDDALGEVFDTLAFEFTYFGTFGWGVVVLLDAALDLLEFVLDFGPVTDGVFGAVCADVVGEGTKVGDG